LNRLIILLAVAIVAVATGCSKERGEPSEGATAEGQECQPDCDSRSCGPDGCGGYCRFCPGGSECRQGKCVFEVCLDENDLDWDGCTDGHLSEFIVTSSTEGHQFHPAISYAGSQRIVVGWQGHGEEDQSGAFIRIFDFKGTPVGDDRPLGLSSSLLKENPQLAPLQEGFVAAWSERQSEDESMALARLFSSSGVPRGEPIELAPSSRGDHSSVALAAAPDVGFFASWSTFRSGGTNFDIAARFFDVGGNPLTDEIMVNATTDYDQLGSALVVLADGNVLIAWHSFHQDGSKQGLFARLFSPAGVALDEAFPLNRHTPGSQWSPTLAALPQGGFVAGWSGLGSVDKSGVFGRRFDATGKPLGPEFLINQFTRAQQQEPDVAAFADGRILFGWESWHDPENECEVMLRWYDANGLPMGDSFQVNTERWEGQGDPAIAILPDGRAFAVWYSYGQDGSERGIFGRVLPAPAKLSR
jgi:hypothetical protein